MDLLARKRAVGVGDAGLDIGGLEKRIFGKEFFRRVPRGERIAQLVPAPVLQAEFAEAETLEETQRGGGGFGSTGR